MEPAISSIMMHLALARTHGELVMLVVRQRTLFQG